MSDGRGKYVRKSKVYAIEGLPIDDAATKEKFGYAAMEVSPSSLKKVCCYCTQCKRPFERQRGRITVTTICRSCAHTKAEGATPFPHKSGYEKTELVCVTCGEKFERRRMSANEGSQCRPCIRKTYWDTQAPVEEVANVYLLDKETQERFGYAATTIRVRSFQMVVVRCVKCRSTFERIRRNVVEQPVCEPCSYVSRDTNPGKRKETIIQTYGTTGLVFPSYYGKAEGSFGERLEEIIDRKLVRQRVLPNGQRIDFYDEVSKIGIEYNGLHWHHEKSLTPHVRNSHREKQRISAGVGIDLVTVFEDEWLKRQYQVENVLLARLGVYAQHIGARQCVLRELTPLETDTFLLREHLQGAPAFCRYAWGLEKEGQLLAVLTLAPHPRAGHDESIVLNRLCFARSIQVRGGASRLLSAALKSLHGQGYKKLLSWSDNRWSKGAVYEKLGFTCVEELPPDYTYVVVAKPRERLSKQSQVKNRTGCPAGTTETEWAHQNGLTRVWDCGKKRWEICLKD